MQIELLKLMIKNGIACEFKTNTYFMSFYIIYNNICKSYIVQMYTYINEFVEKHLEIYKMFDKL